MFPIKPSFVRRVSFATRLFPRIKSVTGINNSRATSSSDLYDGEVFCGGRSRNKDLLTFFGCLAESHGSSTFTQLPLFRRSLRKLVDLVELELESIGAQQVLMPTLIPEKLWIESGRLDRQSNAFDNVYRLQNESQNPQLLGPTFEETVTKLVADMPPLNQSDLPILLYQTSQKFRHETNPRFGLLRTNEFLMNDLYSFDANLDDAKKTYDKVSELYDNIFSKIGIGNLCKKIESNPGNIGGKFSHEYQLVVSGGEDSILKCKSCDHSFNLEMIESDKKSPQCPRCQSDTLETHKALELGHTFLLSDIYSKPFNAKYLGHDGQLVNYAMGCYGLGLSRIIGAVLDLYATGPSHKEPDRVRMRWPNQIEPYSVAIVTPAHRSKQYQSGSTELAERITNTILETTPSDIYVEDRGKESLVRRLINIQAMGFPHIIVMGSKLLDDPPKLELHTLNKDKDYEQQWLTEDQIYSFLNKFYSN